MKKFLSIVLTVLLIVSVMPSGVFTFTASASTSDGYSDSGSCGTNVYWSYDESSRTLEIRGTGAMKSYDNDDYVNGRPSYYPLSQRITHLIINEGVTQIGTDAFKSLIFLRDVVIPKSMTIIRGNAFGSTYLKSIYNYSSLNFVKGSTSYGGIAQYATFIGNYYRADGTCGNDATWFLDSRYGILYINGSGAMNNGCYSKWAIYNSDIRKIVIQNGITNVGNEAFKGCTYVNEVTIPNSVTSIGSEAFSNLTSLSTISIPNNVSSIGERAFSGCTYLNSIVLPNILTKIENDLFNGCTNLNNIIIPDAVVEIGENAFYGCSSLTNINLSTNLKKIGANAFYNCVNLTEIALPTEIASIGSDAFLGCNGLKQVNIVSIEDWCNITFANQHSNPIYYSKALSLNGNNIKSLMIPETVSNIKAYSFTGCVDLTNVEFHVGVTSVGRYAFAECYNISEVTLPIELVDIGEEAFDESVVIFGYKGSESEEYANQNGNTFYSRSNNTVNDLITWSYDRGTLYINGLNSIPDYNLFTSTPWYEIKDHIKSVEIDERITSVGTYSFYGCDNLVAVATDNKNLIFGQYSVNTSNVLTFYGFSGGSLEEYCSNNHLNFVEHLKKPNITEITPDTITVEKNIAWLYSLDKINWTNSNVFKNLNECTEYTVYVRRAEGLTPMAMRSSEGAVVTTLPYPTPDMPVLFKMTADTIEVVKIEGLEYSIDKENWNSTGSFTGLKCLTSYRVYARPITDIIAAQKVSEPLAVTTPDYPTPEAPTLNTVTDTTISVNTISGFEYSLDKIDWTTTGKFTGLSPAQSYSLYVRPVTTIPEAQKISEALVVTTLKSTVLAPSAPAIESYNDGKVVIAATEGYEYSKDGTNWQTSKVTGYEYKMDNGSWQSSNVFSGLLPYSSYTFYQRVAATSTSYASASSNALSVTTNKATPTKPSAPTLSSKTDTTVTLTKVTGYEYKMDNGSWQSSNVFSGLLPYSSYTFYQRVAATSTSYASASSNALMVTTNKSYVAKPTAPIVSNKTSTAVTLSAISGYEYSKDGTTWQVSSAFTELLPNTAYVFYQRVAETDTSYASEKSEGLMVTTLKNTVNAPPAPIVESKSTTTVTLTAISGYEYSMDGINWQKGNVFTGLSGGLAYTFFQRIAETNTSYASAASTSISVRLYAPGDIDGIEGVTDADAEYLLMYTFFPEDYPVNQDCDFNGDGFVNDADAEHLLMYTFFPEDYPLK